MDFFIKSPPRSAPKVFDSNTLHHKHGEEGIITLILPTRLHPFDLALIVLYLVGITLFGLRFRKSGKDRSLKNYFLASNTIPWWAISLSIVSAETSTLTIISIPGVAFAGDLGFLQIVIGYMLGRIVVAALFLPKYFQGQMLTAYQLIDQRFGPTLHKVTAGLFLLTRAAAEGVRVFAVSIVVGIAIGTNDTLSIAIISALTLLYTFEGGMAAVIWTDVVQMAIYIGGTIVAIATLGTHVPGGWSTHPRHSRCRRQVPPLQLRLQPHPVLHLLGRSPRRNLPHHGLPRHRPAHGPAHARRPQPPRIPPRPTLQRSSHLPPVHPLPPHRSGLYVFYNLHPQVFASADRIFPTFIVTRCPSASPDSS